MKNHFSALVVLVVLLGLMDMARAAGRTTPDLEGSTREEILTNRAQRRKQLDGLLQEAKKQLGAHKNGKKVLESDALRKLEQKIHVYEKKLETMEGEMDEREVERILKRDELRFHRDEERRRRREREEL